MLNKRQERVITLLKDNKKWITGKELSEFLNVSDRTIRSDITCINLYYDGILIESDVRKGYHLNGDASANLNIHSENIIPQTCFQRCFYIIHELLFKKNELNLVELMGKVFVRDTSIENDIKEIKKILVPYSTLKLLRSKNYIYLEGSEEEKRKLYVNLLSKKAKGNFLNLDFLASLFPDFDLIAAKELLMNILKKYNYSVREMEFPAIMTYIGTSIERMLCNNYIESDIKKENIKNSAEFSIANEFFKNASKKLNIQIKEDENVVLAFLLLERKQFDSDNKALLLNSDYKVNELISNILEDIYTQFDVDLRKDEDLREGLSLHIQMLLQRKKKNVQIPNLYLDELKYKYPFFFEMAIRVGNLIEKELNITIDENDISFIEQHFGGALERMNFKNKYKAVMINPNNQALSKLCIKKIESIFHERMVITDSMSFFEKKEILKANPDLILTTFPLEHDLNILTVQISIFVNSKDETQIFKALNLLDSRKSKEKFITSFKSMMDPRFFYFNLDLDTPEKILNFMSDEMYNAGIVDKDFKGAVLKREELSPTSFIYSFAIPHPIGAISRESKISAALLKKPIQWGEFQVKLVLLLAIEKDNEKIIRTFFDWLSDMVDDPKKLSSLMKTKNYDEFIDLIAQ